MNCLVGNCYNLYLRNASAATSAYQAPRHSFMYRYSALSHHLFQLSLYFRTTNARQHLALEGIHKKSGKNSTIDRRDLPMSRQDS